MAEDNIQPKASRTVTEWFLEGIKKVFVDHIGAFVVALVDWFLVSKFAGVAVLFIITSFTYLWNRFSQITFPAFVIPLLFLAFVILNKINKRFGMAIRNVFHKTKERELFNLLWHVHGNEVSGPFCPICHSPVVFPKQDFMLQAEIIAEKIKGVTETRSFVYRCTGCEYYKELDLNPENLVKLIRQAIGI